MMNSPLSDYWKLLDTFDDYLRHGIRTVHPAMPSLERKAAVRVPAAGGSPAVGTDDLDSVAREVESCTLCGLHRTRTKAVPGEGVSSPLVIVIGEGPGGDEDLTGRPFVGKAGQYLDKWLAAIGLSRETNCFIANIVKCRPPANRDPEPGESAACLPYLIRQIDLLRPKFILSVGRIAAHLLTGRQEGIGRIRGSVYEYRGIPVVPTYHPSGVLRNQAEYKPLVWEDLKVLKQLLNRED